MCTMKKVLVLAMSLLFVFVMGNMTFVFAEGESETNDENQTYTVTFVSGDKGYFEEWDDEKQENVRLTEVQEEFKAGEILWGRDICIDDKSITFDGWYLDEALTDPLDDHKETSEDTESGRESKIYYVQGDITVYAGYSVAHRVEYVVGEHGYMLDWELDSESNEWKEIKIQTKEDYIKDGEFVPEIGIEVEEGFTFDGWFLDEGLTDPVSNHYDTVDDGAKGIYIAKNDVTFYAKCSPTEEAAAESEEAAAESEEATAESEESATETEEAATDTEEPAAENSAPKTGDESNIALWLVIMGIAVAAFVKSLRISRK